MKFYFFLILFPVLCVASVNNFSGTVFHIKGKALVAASDGVFGPLSKGDLLSEGDSIKTGKKSLVIIRFPDNSTMRVEPNSHVQFDSIVERIDNTSVGSTSLVLKAGRSVINVINKSQAPVFKVRTKSVSIGVRGTSFYAGIDDESSDLDVAVKKGEVEVAKIGEPDTADAVDAGQGLTVEKGQTFTQPKSYDWVNKVNYNAADKNVDPDYFSKMLSAKRLEFRQKREKWKRNKEKWLKKKSLWNDRKSNYLKRTNSLKGKREDFLKKKQDFLKKKKNLDFKRSNYFKSSNGLKRDALKLKSDRAQLRKEISDYRKSGKKDPAKMKELLARKKKLDLKRGSLKDQLSGLKKQRVSLGSGQQDLLKAVPSNEAVKKQLKKKAKKERKKVVRKQKNRAKKKVEKKAQRKVRSLLGL